MNTFIDANFIDTNTDFLELVDELKQAFAKKEIITPPRHHHDLPNTVMKTDTTLLLMPSWQDSNDGGVKVVTVSPENGQLGLPSINGSYLYLDAKTGILKAILEAKTLTAKRTASASALASSFLSRKDADSMLIIGTGALSMELIKAHAAVRPIKKVYVWGRRKEKAKAICDQLQNESFVCTPIEQIKDVISEVGIVSAATLSEVPLIFGKYLQKGQHIDLVGSYKPTMREADDRVVKRAKLFADTIEMATKESGDLKIPLSTGVIAIEDIKGDLFSLCQGQKGRESEDEITLFKSVGHAMEDLIAARYFYKKYVKDDVR